ncbi:MAG: tryptophan-rich sensory protein [Rikenellaceae bacterium]|nr:tryptophan-rich sensory protein [Rikenellaceae bacterium]
MKKIIYILIAVLVCFSAGYAASLFQEDSLREWYPYLNKPSILPPNFVFPIAWSIIYILMGISAGLIMDSSDSRRKNILLIFAVQFVLNFSWSLMFFYFRSPVAGLIDIFLLDMFVIYYIFKSYPVNKISSYLFIPYFLWLLFATYLNSYILLNN